MAPLHIQTIKNHLKNPSVSLEILQEVHSTNTYLKQCDNHITSHSKSWHICLAEKQTQGRGRGDHHWHSPAAENIYLSLSCHTTQSPTQLARFSLVAGLSTCQAIEQVCPLPEHLSVKWPNDILYQHKKLAGLLIETQASASNQQKIIIGIGINVNMLDDHQCIQQAWTSLKKITGNSTDRNILSATVINQITADFEQYEQHGMGDFLPAWHHRDALCGNIITLHSAGKKYTGRALGINHHGQLRLQTETQSTPLAFFSGDTHILK